MKLDKKTTIGFVVAAVVAVGAYLTNGGDVMTAVKLAFDREAAAAECKVLLSEQVTEAPVDVTPAQ